MVGSSEYSPAYLIGTFDSRGNFTVKETRDVKFIESEKAENLNDLKRECMKIQNGQEYTVGQSETNANKISNAAIGNSGATGNDVINTSNYIPKQVKTKIEKASSSRDKPQYYNDENYYTKTPELNSQEEVIEEENQPTLKRLYRYQT